MPTLPISGSCLHGGRCAEWSLDPGCVQVSLPDHLLREEHTFFDRARDHSRGRRAEITGYKREPRRQYSDAAASRLTESWDQPGHPPYMVCEPGTATRYGTDSPLQIAFRCPSHHRASRPPGRRMAGDGDLRSFNPHPPLLHLHQMRRKTPASPEIRCLTNCFCGNSPLGTVLNVRSSGRVCHAFGEPLPPGA